MNTLHHFLCIHPDDLCYLGPISWNCPSPPNTLKQVQRLSDGLKTWVRLHLMWNLEFGTLDDFWYILAHVMGYLGPISRTGANALYTWLRPHLIPEMYSWTHCQFLCIPPDDLYYLDPVSWNCPNPPNTLKQVQLDPQMAFTLEQM